MSVYRILGGIYISSVEPLYKGLDIRNDHGIEYIISVQKQSIPEFYTKDPYRHLQISVDDDEKSNIIAFFEQTNRFICFALYGNSDQTPDTAKAAKHKSNILIHCNAGCSRSPTILAAFLMKYYQMSLKVALYAMKRVKSDVCPNDTFLHQLKLYEELGCQDSTKILEGIPTYKQMVLELGCDNHEALVKSDDLYGDDSTNINVSSVLRCRRCRGMLANSTSFIPHEPPSGDKDKQAFFVKNAFKSKRVRNIQRGANECTHYFVEPLKWMQPELSLSELEAVENGWSQQFTCRKLRLMK
ncbi:Protein phosphatase [Ogataea parapolymorpha DL-1]|uniref:protein-tyrosine-phosphatase n=1 Tax=Ogataea parapolymorpha (strain ATCC 26012 / BCRC 20466 / JCM 22074 / NRRL Y-7560 / DL-1) TaxID=871575 RepID=W1QB58_OGAPD|nr:Protein phosphatase [Ogataea parapolymorpha DL-1]ESW97614.1 Protein phosphatase [Ogataea parapolymorpha DL-1]